jgi:hypothetical protein
MSPRGGSRPGAGAPKGNVNALRSGAYSAKVQAWVETMCATPRGRRVLDALMSLEPATNLTKEKY